MSTGFSSPFGGNTNPFGRLETTGMQRVAEEDENDMVTSPTTASFGRAPADHGAGLFRSPFGADAASDTHMTGVNRPHLDPTGYPAQYNLGRRTSVSAESLKPPTGEAYDNWTPPVHPKTPEQLERLKEAISGNFLFSHLDDEQTAQVLGALIEKPIPSKDIKVSWAFVLAKKGTTNLFGR